MRNKSSLFIEQSNEKLIEMYKYQIWYKRGFIKQGKKDVKGYKKNIWIQEEFIRCYKEDIKELKNEIRLLKINKKKSVF